MRKLLPTNQPKLDQDFTNLAVDILATDYSMLEILPMSAKKSVLPHLALMFDVDITGLSEKSARIYIQNALEIHRYKGTVYAVKKAIDAMFDDAELYEWFDCDLAAGLFDIKVKVKADFEMIYTPAKFRKAKEIINNAKNVRSHLNSFDITLPLMMGAIEKSEAQNLSLELDKTHIVKHNMNANVDISSTTILKVDIDLPYIATHTIVNQYQQVGGVKWTL